MYAPPPLVDLLNRAGGRKKSVVYGSLSKSLHEERHVASERRCVPVNSLLRSDLILRMFPFSSGASYAGRQYSSRRIPERTRLPPVVNSHSKSTGTPAGLAP